MYHSVSSDTVTKRVPVIQIPINPLNPELNRICYLLALLGAHHFLHVSRIRIKLLTFRRLMSYIYIYIYDISRLRVKYWDFGTWVLLHDALWQESKDFPKYWSQLKILDNRRVAWTKLRTAKVKGKAIPLQAWTGPEDSRRLRLPDFKTIGTWMW